MNSRIKMFKIDMENIEKHSRNIINIAILSIFVVFILSLAFYKGLRIQEYFLFALLTIFAVFFLKERPSFHGRLIGGIIVYISSLIVHQETLREISLILLCISLAIIVLGIMFKRIKLLEFNLFDVAVILAPILLLSILIVGEYLTEGLGRVNVAKIAVENMYLFCLPLIYLVFSIAAKSIEGNRQAERILLMTILGVAIFLGLRISYAVYHYKMGDYFGHNNIDNAIKEFEIVDGVLPSLLWVNTKLGELYMSVGLYNEAIEEFERFRNYNPTDKKEVLSFLKFCYLKTRMWDKINPLNSNGVKGLLFEDYYSLAQELARRFDFESAIFELEEIKPTIPIEHYRLGRLWYEIGVYDRAIKVLSPIFKGRGASDFKDISILLGNSQLEMGRYELAIDSFRKALDIDENSKEAICGLGRAYGGLGRNKNAIAQYERLLKLDTKYVYTHTPLDRLYRIEGLEEKTRSFSKNKTRYVKEVLDRDSWQSPHGWRLSTNYSAVAEIRLKEGKTTLWIFARGKPAKNVWPIMAVGIDEDEIVSFYVSSRNWKRYRLEFVSDKGKYRLWVRFKNDCYLPRLGEDRNLYVGKVTREI